jgi:hypothetical protein
VPLIGAEALGALPLENKQINKMIVHGQPHLIHWKG